MTDAFVLWSHALPALLFAALALWAVRRADDDGLPRWPLATMLAVTAVWALAIAGIGPSDPATRLIDGIRNLAMFALMAALLRRGGATAPAGIAPIYGVVAVVVVSGTILQLVAAALAGQADGAEVATAAMLLRVMVDVAALMLVHNLHGARRRGDVALLCAALGCIWGADLGLATTAYLTGEWLPALQVVRGAATALAGGMIAAAMQRRDRRPVAVSRTVAYQSLSLVAIGGYLTLLALVTSGLSAIGGANARLYQTAFVFGSAAAALTLASSPWLRAWAKVKIAKHLYRHRYDYRAEWLRFTATLAKSAADAPLATRVVKAVADLTTSPAGLLLVRDGPALGVGAAWNWPDPPATGAPAALVEHLAASERIVELDPLRAGHGDATERDAVPAWMLADAAGWALVPLIHDRDLVGAILLARPPLDRALDWEDFDLLKVAGRQVASYLAEAHAQEALAEGQRFDEFNRRFAFIVHDIKNLVSGISLVARNAERHADNPDFRADMIATLQDSAAKMNALLARLSAGDRARAEASVPVPLVAFAERLAGMRRATHPVSVAGDAGIIAQADPVRLEQLVGHLLTNAIEASAAGAPVTIEVSGNDGQAVIAVRDRGCGMTPAFVRDQLFRPFVSSKPAGFGIGAFEARQLAESMGGRIDVESRENEGSMFRVTLPAAPAFEAAA
ncbi:PEP-CTERM system histidine kinase PrsK [Sphingomonas donggukensis]|uniref:histidine kinase n=1 Tax=Sphingomonas donggukensis TaxID=2949093 RepID=A0ABY4TTQ9_9SPHN|nr:XrtA/PEP-CTERM system histidine kinase PrsK [Sphingomonas donggukensis]URW75776.1 PEP-CTERM system histidine kinase PrsK [Sphingomonas donggukensis]